MRHPRSGLAGIAYSTLEVPWVYDFFQWATGGRRTARVIVDEYLPAGTQRRILDVGCGTAPISRYLTEDYYFGFDTNGDYLATAKRNNPRANVWQADAGLPGVGDSARFDAIVAIGVLHHLDDDRCTTVLKVARDHLVDGGLLITMDPCFSDGQGSIDKWLVSRDRGTHVRREQQYENLVSRYFLDVRLEVRTDILRIPYTEAIILASL